jgi:hypothetical protein
MKRVMDKRQRACQIWGSSRGKKWSERGPAVAGRGERGQIDRVDLGPTAVVAEVGARWGDCERESVARAVDCGV